MVEKITFTVLEPNEDFLFRVGHKNIQVGIYSVMFGFRVRAGYINNPWSELDYCCGSDPNYVKKIFNMITTLVRDRIEKHGPESHEIFISFPEVNVKPIFNDDKCFLTLVEMLKGLELTNIEIPDIVDLKRTYLRKLF